MQKIKDKIISNFALSETEEKIVSDILCDEMNLDRCSEIIDTIISLRLGNESLIAFLGYQLFKVKPEQADKIAQSFSEEELGIFETFKVVKDVSNLSSSEEAEDIRKLFLSLSKDLRVVIIKLAGILYDIKHITPPLTLQNIQFIDNVKNIFAPLAERLGLGEMKSNMEDYCFKFQNPKVYSQLENNVMLKKEDNDKQIQITKAKLLTILSELGIKGEITYRQKHLSSVFKKLQTKGTTLAQVYDLIAMRVLVEKVEDCYAVLGKIHSIYKPMQGRVKDYIANPKPNGYQSLHTTIIAENERPLEIQIRTYEMHRNSEYGVAAHWIYKEKRSRTTSLDKKISWFREIMENAKEMPLEEFVETLKTDLYGGEIFVQTPKGKVLQFPEGATIIDFAYAIHSDIGNSCVGGRINNKMKPIATELKNGDIVEIITSSTSKGPSRDWLSYVKTSSARSKIRTFFKQEMKEENISTGKTMLEEAIAQRNFTWANLCSDDALMEACLKSNVGDVSEMYAAIGSGSLSVGQVVGKLIGIYNKNHQALNVSTQTIKVKQNDQGIMVDGTTGLLIRYAGCCNPIFGDEIVGYISHGKGLTIHRKSCLNCKYLEQERLLPAEWEDRPSAEFIVNLKCIADKNPTNIAKITSVIGEMKISIKAFESKESKDEFTSTISIVVKNKDDINRVILALEGIKGIRKVYRSE